MTNKNIGGEGIDASFTPTPFTLSLHPKFLSNPLSLYPSLLGEGVKGYRERNKTFTKDVLFICRKFEILILHLFLHLHPPDLEHPEPGFLNLLHPISRNTQNEHQYQTTNF